MFRFLLLPILVAMLSLAGPVSAQTNDDKPEINAAQATGIANLMDPFFQAVQAGEVTKAYADLFAGTLLETKVMETQQLVSQTTFIFQTYGAIQGWDVMDSECATDRLCKVEYVIHTDKGPVFVWAYVYQRQQGEWMITLILFGDTTAFAF